MMSASAVSSVSVFMPLSLRSGRDKSLELFELLGPALFGTGHCFGGRHRLEVGLSHGERGVPVAGLKGQFNERCEELALLVVDGPATHDQAMRTIDFVILTTHVVGELGLRRDGARPLHREPVGPPDAKVHLCGGAGEAGGPPPFLEPAPVCES